MNPKIKLLNKFIERQNRNFTRPLPTIPKRDICMLASLMKHKFAAKGEIILNNGEVLQDIIFVEEGMVRQSPSHVPNVKNAENNGTHSSR